MRINNHLKSEELAKKLEQFWRIYAEKIRLIQHDYYSSKGSPVFTVNGKYTSRGWTEWTQSFQFGSTIFLFELKATNPIYQNPLLNLGGNIKLQFCYFNKSQGSFNYFSFVHVNFSYHFNPLYLNTASKR